MNTIAKELSKVEIGKLYSHAIGTYKKTSTVAKSNKSSAQPSANKDKVEFNLDSSLNAAKANAASCADAEVNTARIEQLQQAYCGDSCPVTSEQTAEAIFNG